MVKTVQFIQLTRTGPECSNWDPDKLRLYPLHEEDVRWDRDEEEYNDDTEEYETQTVVERGVEIFEDLDDFINERTERTTTLTGLAKYTIFSLDMEFDDENNLIGIAKTAP